MLERTWDYINNRTTFVDKVLFIIGFVIGVGTRSEDPNPDPFSLLIAGLLLGFFCLGVWKLAKAGMRR